MSATGHSRKLMETLHQAANEDRTIINFDMNQAKIRGQEIVVSPIENQETQSPRSVRINGEVQQQLYRWISHPFTKLKDTVSPETHQRVLDEQFQTALNLEGSDRKLPTLTRLVLTDGAAIGILPTKLFAASNEQFVTCFFEAAEAACIDLADAEVRASSSRPGLLSLNATFPKFIAEPKAGDFVHFGLSLRHSSVGSVATHIGFYAYRLVCTNGQVAPVCLSSNGKRTILRRGHDTSAENTLACIRETVKAAFKHIPSRMKAIEKLNDQPVNLTKAISELVERNRWSRHVQHALDAAREQGEHDANGDETAFGIVNLLSYVGTHGSQDPKRHPIPTSVLARMQLVSGVYAGQGVHQCKHCNQILSPSNN